MDEEEFRRRERMRQKELDREMQRNTNRILEQGDREQRIRQEKFDREMQRNTNRILAQGDRRSRDILDDLAQKNHDRVMSNSGGGGGCFIATAAYGTPLAPEINVLRNWRDNSLSKTWFGRLFVKVYYNTSPPIARFIAKRESLKRLVRGCLKPMIRQLKRKK
jgi:hypothetical protein